MPATNVLQIQGRDEGPPTIVELQGSSIRVGRGRRCEVRLPGSRLAEIQCILRRNHEGWQIQPLGPPGLLSIYGESIFASRMLDFNVPLRVGDYWLTLRSLAPAKGTFDEPIIVEPDGALALTSQYRDLPPLPNLMAPVEPAPQVQEPVSLPKPEPEPAPIVAAEPEQASTAQADAERLKEWEASLLERERRLHERQNSEKRWEAKWRAAGERLRRSAAHSVPPGSQVGIQPIPAVPPMSTTPPISAVPPSAPKIPRVPVDLSRPPIAPRTVAEPIRKDYHPPRLLSTPHTRTRPAPSSTPIQRPSPIKREHHEPRPEPEARSAEPVEEIGVAPQTVAWVAPPAEPLFEAEWTTHELDALVAEPATSEPETETDLTSPIAEIEVETELDLEPVCVIEPEPTWIAPPEVIVEDVVDVEVVVPAEPLVETVIEMEAQVSAEPEPVVTEVEAVEPEAVEAPEEEPEADDFLISASAFESVEMPEEALARVVDLDAQDESPIQVQGVLAIEPVFPVLEADWSSSTFEAVTVDPMVTSVGPAPQTYHSSITQMSPWEEPAAFRPVAPPVRPVAAPVSWGVPVESPGVAPRREQATPEPGLAAGHFPSAGVILAAQGKRVVADPVRPRKVAAGPKPTESRAPEQWNAPFWLAMIPALGVLLGLGGSSLALSTLWAMDDQLAATAMASAFRAETDSGRLDPEVRPNTAWYRTTAGHLAAWALAIDRSGEGQPAQQEIAGLLEAAKHIAPLHPTIRFALAQNPKAEPSAILGLSRDAASLALSARLLRQNGKSAEAIKLYRQAFELAEKAEPIQKAPLSFDADPQVRRYRLLQESEIRLVARGLVDQADWPHSEWSQAAPDSAVVRLGVARLLREKGSPDAQAAFEQVLLVNDAGTARPADHWAARGEALAFLARGSESVESYRKAIDSAPNSRASRLFSYNLAEILRPLAQEETRSKLLQAATGDDPGEEITRRALDAQALSGMTASRTPPVEPTSDPKVSPASQELSGGPDPIRGAP